jgi:hypothetical protein
MQIELMGCTGAGKSTLIRGMLEACRTRGLDALLGDDLVLQQVGLSGLKSHLSRTFFVDLLCLVGCLLAWRHNRLYVLIIRTLWHLPSTVGRFEKLNIARNVFKRIGVYEIARRRAPSTQLVLLDGGTLQTAHPIFVHVSIEPDLRRLSAMVRLLPLPDVAVYVQQDEAVLIERTLLRGHNRIPHGLYDNVERFIKHAVATFEQLRQEPTLEDKLLIVNSHGEIIVPSDHHDHPSLPIALELVRTGINLINANLNATAVSRGS